MPLIGTNMPNYTFLAHFKPQILSSRAQELKLKIHLTESPKHDNIYKLCLYILEEHKIMLNITILICARAEI